MVGLTRTVYVPGAKPNASGSYRAVPYEPGVIDYFFILTRSRDIYLIPAPAVAGATNTSSGAIRQGSKVDQGP